MNNQGESRQPKVNFGLETPRLFASLLFFLLFSGPPSLRLRSPDDSLEAVVDPAVIVQASVWVIGGIWSLYQVYKGYRSRTLMPLYSPNKFGLIMVLFLGLSTVGSEAPMLTAFKVGQILVSLLFAWIFVQRYGIARSINFIFWGSTILCVAIAVAVFAAPDLVLFSDEGNMRLRGDPIAVMGIVGTYSAILLLARKREISRLLFWPLLALVCTLLAFSLTRQAWFLVFAFLVLYVAKGIQSPVVRKFGFLFLVVFPLIFLFYVLPAFEIYRATDSVWSLTGRTDLWVYLVGIALFRSPWIGLGYYSASRILGPEFNPGMGTAHSMLVEVFLGGGLLSLVPSLALCFVLSRRAFKFLRARRTDLEFLCGALFFVTLALALMGGDFAYGQVGITFWCLTTAIPAMQAGRLRSVSLAALRSNSRPLRAPIPRTAEP